MTDVGRLRRELKTHLTTRLITELGILQALLDEKWKTLISALRESASPISLASFYYFAILVWRLSQTTGTFSCSPSVSRSAFETLITSWGETFPKVSSWEIFKIGFTSVSSREHFSLTWALIKTVGWIRTRGEVCSSYMGTLTPPCCSYHE